MKLCFLSNVEGGKGPIDRQVDRIKQMQQAIKSRDERIRELEQIHETAEREVNEKGAEIVDMLDRLKKYESGLF